MSETPDLTVVVMTSAPSTEEGARLAKILVEERLAACVSRVPAVHSHFRWEGEIQEAKEELLVIKTHARRAPELTRRLAEIHPYDVPEILVLPVAAGLPSYLEWIRRETLVEGEPS